MPDQTGPHATLAYDGASYDLPVVTGTQDETAVYITGLRLQSGLSTLDRG
jgi:citrate synthase